MGKEELERLYGRILSEGQVHLPVRLFARDMVNAGFPVVRYEIRWTPEQVRPLGTSFLPLSLLRSPSCSSGAKIELTWCGA